MACMSLRPDAGMQGARQAAHQCQGRSFIGSMCSRRHAFKDGVHEPVRGGRCAGCGAGCPPASFSTSIEDLYGDVCSRWHACHHGVRQKGRVWGRRPTSVLLHQRDQRVQRGGPARDVQGAEGVLGGGHHQHGRLDAGHVVDWVVPRHLVRQAGEDPVLPAPLHMASHAFVVGVLHATAGGQCAVGIRIAPVAHVRQSSLFCI